MTQHLQFEAKKDSLRQNQDGTIKLSLTVNPLDVDITRLFAAPMGKIYQVVLVDAEAIQEPVKEKDTLTQQASIMSTEPAFWQFVKLAYNSPDDSYIDGSDAMRRLCGVKSRSEIKEHTEAGEAFKMLKSHYNYWLKNG